MGNSHTDKPVGRTPRKRAGLVAALALTAALIASQAAFAQSGGVGAPGGTTTTTDPSTTTSSGYTQVFPLPGAHSYGDGFGAARSGHTHQGVDIMSACGEPLVAVSRAKVKWVSFQRSAGNYIVLRYKKLHQDYAYMHLAARAPLTKGQIVQAGQFVGNVGDTGDASACHLHFELWVGKWYRGGHPVDPMAYLQNWDSYS